MPHEPHTATSVIITRTCVQDKLAFNLERGQLHDIMVVIEVFNTSEILTSECPDD